MITKLPDGSAFFTATIMSKEEAMALPLKDRPICFRITSEMYHAVFEAIGAASMCWKPRPGEQVFASEEASKVAVELCFKIAGEVENKTSDLEQQLAQAQAACAEFRHCIEKWRPFVEGTQDWTDFGKALSNDCGKGWLSPDEAKALQVDAAAMRDALETGHIVNAFREDRTVAEQIKDNESRRIKALSTTAGRSLLERLERYEKALTKIRYFKRSWKTGWDIDEIITLATQALKGGDK